MEIRQSSYIRKMYGHGHDNVNAKKQLHLAKYAVLCDVNAKKQLHFNKKADSGRFLRNECFLAFISKKKVVFNENECIFALIALVFANKNAPQINYIKKAAISKRQQLSINIFSF